MSKKFVLVVAFPVCIALAAALYFSQAIDRQKQRLVIIESGLKRLSSETTDLAELEPTTARVLERMNIIELLHAEPARRYHLVLAELAADRDYPTGVSSLTVLNEQVMLGVNGDVSAAAEDWLAGVGANFPALKFEFGRLPADDRTSARAQ
jgi:Tfp pilus assembly protein PilN